MNTGRHRVRFSKLSDLEENLESVTGLRKKTFIERFWACVDIGLPDECWRWKGKPGKNGYGNLSISDVQYNVHRLSFVIAHGVIDPELFVIHSCDNKICVNPAHLSQGTLEVNNREAFERNLMRRGERHGMAKLSEEQVDKIRQLHAAGGLTQTAIAKQYGVWNAQISRIVNYKSRIRP